MAITQISGNQISTSTQAIITTLSFLNANSVLRIPAGTTANGDAKFTNGMSAGPIAINNGFTVTIENNAAWSIR